jgi:hypothetical protein
VDAVAEESRVRLNARQRARQQRIVKGLSAVELALHGSVEVRRTRCGNTGCACHGDPPKLHGPYIVWTRKVDGRTVTRVLSEEQYADYQDLFENSRRIKQLVAELHDLTLEAVEADARLRGRPGRSNARSAEG